MSAGVLALALLLAAAPQLRRDGPATAPVGEQRVEIEGLELRARYAWPDELQKGFFPIRVELANSRSEAVEVELRATHLNRRDRVVRRVALAPGETRRFDLLGRGEPRYPDTYSIELTAGRAQQRTLPIGPSATQGGERAAVLALSEAPLEPGRSAQWESLLGSADHVVGAALFDDMPDELAAYTSLDAVVLDATRGLPPNVALAPLAAWVRTGGVLVVYGALASELAHESSELAPWLEERFLLAQPSQGVSDHLCGQGRLVLVDRDDPFSDGGRAVRLAAMGAPRWVPGPDHDRSRALHPTTWPTRPLPLRGLAALLVLFALVIGPLNFLLVKRLGRPVLLLLTVPAIALASALLLFGYGIAVQGLDVAVTRLTATVLDQRAHRASTAEVRRLFAGLSPGPGLRPAATSAVLVARAEGDTIFQRGLDELFLLEQDDAGALYGADYLPVRRPVVQTLLGDAPARARLDVARRGGELEVTNALGAPIHALVLRAADGSWHGASAAIAEGASALLATIPALEAESRASRAPAQLLGLDDFELPRGTYFAELERSPFTDDCGMEVVEREGRHLLFGVLDEGGDAR